MNDQKTDYGEKFINNLVRLSQSENRGALATLRRAAPDPCNSYEILPVIGHFLPAGCSDWEFNIFMLVACLYAIHPDHTENSENLGLTLRKFSRKTDGSESFETRFASLLNSNPEDLPHRLVQIFRQISRESIPVNYSLLLRDLKFWDSQEQYSKKSWAKSFWTAKGDDNDENTNETNNN